MEVAFFHGLLANLFWVGMYLFAVSKGLFAQH